MLRHIPLLEYFKPTQELCLVALPRIGYASPPPLRSQVVAFAVPPFTSTMKSCRIVISAALSTLRVHQYEERTGWKTGLEEMCGMAVKTDLLFLVNVNVAGLFE